MGSSLRYSAFIQLYQKFYTWLLPYHCILCRAYCTRKQDLCEDCHAGLPVITHACPRCAQVMTTPGLACGTCLSKQPPFDVTHALYLYQEPISNLILNLKFQHTLVNARILGELLLLKIQSDWYSEKPLPEVIIPIPLHATRLKERGFNQALEIARPIAHSLDLPIDYTSCARQQATLAQATLHPKERKQNIKNAFQIVKPLPYRHIAVIDDVITTGHTINEFCKTVKKAGVQQIDVWCCARPAAKAPWIF